MVSFPASVRHPLLLAAAALCLTSCGGSAGQGAALSPVPVPTPLPEETLPPQVVIDAALFAVRRTVEGALPALRRVQIAASAGDVRTSSAGPPPTATAPVAQSVSRPEPTAAPTHVQGMSQVQGAPPTPTPWPAPAGAGSPPESHTEFPTPSQSAPPTATPPAPQGGRQGGTSGDTGNAPVSQPVRQEPPSANGQANPPRRYIGSGRSQFVLPGPWTVPSEPGLVCEEAFIVTVASASVHGGPGPDYAVVATVYRDTPLPVRETRGDWLRVAMAGAAGGVGAGTADQHYLDDHWIAAAAGEMGGWCIHLSLSGN